jgi:hypothetical protein
LGEGQVAIEVEDAPVPIGIVEHPEFARRPRNQLNKLIESAAWRSTCAWSVSASSLQRDRSASSNLDLTPMF